MTFLHAGIDASRHFTEQVLGFNSIRIAHQKIRFYWTLESLKNVNKNRKNYWVLFRKGTGFLLILSNSKLCI